MEVKSWTVSMILRDQKHNGELFPAIKLAYDIAQ